ncbi:MAG: hypothetical protein Roseis2KO_45450 [Roseivirga sp.]
MNWNEKIDRIKKSFITDDFSVPHLGRKRILKEIESRFVQRPPDYHHSNDFKEPFGDWWSHLKARCAVNTPSDYSNLLNAHMGSAESYWIICELSNGVFLYKSKLLATMELIRAVQNQTEAFHIVDLKYKHLLALKFESSQLSLKSI